MINLDVSLHVSGKVWEGLEMRMEYYLTLLAQLTN